MAATPSPLFFFCLAVAVAVLLSLNSRHAVAARAAIPCSANGEDGGPSALLLRLFDTVQATQVIESTPYNPPNTLFAIKGEYPSK